MARIMAVSDDRKYTNHESVSLLYYKILRTTSDDVLRSFVVKNLGINASDMCREGMLDIIIKTQNWEMILDNLNIYDFRICSECGSLMHEGYCYGMGYKYYCSKECLHHDFTDEGWMTECKNDDQSYWTDWYEY